MFTNPQVQDDNPVPPKTFKALHAFRSVDETWLRGRCCEPRTACHCNKRRRMCKVWHLMCAFAVSFIHFWLRNETFSAHGPALVSIIAQSVQRLCASSSDAAYADSGLEQAATDLDALRVLTECVRLVRNTAAAGPHAQLGLSGIVPHLSTFLSSTAMLVEGGAAWSAAIAVAKRSVLQSLVNLSSGCEENKRSVWSSCFPNVITTCLTVGLTSADRSMLAVCSALIHTLTVSCEGDTSPNVRLLQLVRQSIANVLHGMVC